MIDIVPCDEQTTWDESVEAFSGHPLQLWGWGTVKATHGWRVQRVLFMEQEQCIGGAQLLIKPLPRPFGPLVYAPRGPFGAWNDREDVRTALRTHVKTHLRATILKTEPDMTRINEWKGWRKTTNRILLSRTAVLDLRKTEAELLAPMSKKTRQYIRKSAKEAIVIRTAHNHHDIDQCLAIYSDTAQRAGFALHTKQYYYDIFDKLGPASPVYIAQHNGEVVAFLWPIVTSAVAFELYGGMNEQGQRLRANYHLKWQVIRQMQAKNVKRYDVNGLLNDGVTTFKKGFIPEETHMAGTFDAPLSPFYWVWTLLVPVVKKIAQMRARFMR